jgi:hypothetical protein
MRRSELEIDPNLYELYQKTSQLKKTGPMKKSENACKTEDKPLDRLRIQKARILRLFLKKIKSGFFIESY